MSRIASYGEEGSEVVVCEELRDTGAFVSELSEYLATEVIRQHFPEELPELPRPLLWIEHRPVRRRGPGRYRFVSFGSYTPATVGVGFVRREKLGAATRRETLAAAEVVGLTEKE